MNDHGTAVLPPKDLAQMSGLDLLQGMIAGKYPRPPIGVTLNFWLTKAEHGLVTFMAEPSADFLNPLGSIHGGWHATLLDTVMACAVHSTLPPGTGYTSVEMKLNWDRAIMPDTGPVRCEGRIITRGQRIATSEGQLFDAKGRLLAHGTETCLIFPMKEA